ncbi:MAG: tail fiber domain-containing protein [Propylenella sp.]
MAGSVGRIGKFITATELGNSVLFESGGRIGLGTTAPLSSLDIRAQNALSIYGGQPYLTFRDSAAGAALHIIQSINGGLNLLPDSYFRNANASAVVHVSRLGRVGLGTKSPQRLLQIGPSVDAMFTIEASDASPRAGFIRFGDRTGWQLRIGRSRESSGGPLNTGLTGALFTFRDDGAFGPTGYPLLATGVEPLCRTLANFITRCEASSLRYKKDVEPYLGGLDVVERLRPIAFTRIYNGRHDIGLAAEEVEEIDPRLTYPNEEGEVEGVKYDLISAALINAVKEQQAQIERQQEQIEALLAAVARLERTNSTR